jgi:hypothetical protein
LLLKIVKVLVVQMFLLEAGLASPDPPLDQLVPVNAAPSLSVVSTGGDQTTSGLGVYRAD